MLLPPRLNVLVLWNICWALTKDANKKKEVLSNYTTPFIVRAHFSWCLKGPRAFWKFEKQLAFWLLTMKLLCSQIGLETLTKGKRGMGGKGKTKLKTGLNAYRQLFLYNFLLKFNRMKCKHLQDEGKRMGRR